MNKYHEEDKSISKEIAKEFGEGWLPPLPKCEIEEPAAWPGQEVVFDNPRVRIDPTTVGVVVHVETHWQNKGRYKHIYEVRPWAKEYVVRVGYVELYLAK